MFFKDNSILLGKYKGRYLVDLEFPNRHKTYLQDILRTKCWFLPAYRIREGRLKELVIDQHLLYNQHLERFHLKFNKDRKLLLNI